MAQRADKISSEKQRVRNEVSRCTQIIFDIEGRRYKEPHIENLRKLIKDCQEALTEDLDARMEKATKYLPLTTASLLLTTMRNLIKDLVDFMYSVVSQSETVPRELYFLLDAFLESHDISEDSYILFVSDEMAVTAFEHVLKLSHMEQWFPIFFQKIGNKRFYFVHVVSDFIGREASLNWPIVLHEMAHVVCYEKNTYTKYLPSVDILEALRSVPEPIFPIKYQKKLYISEYLADLLTTRVIGAVYGWRFLEIYGTYYDILEPSRAHPSPGKRLDKIFREVRKELQMPKSANFLLKEFEPKKKEWETIPKKTDFDLNVDPILRQILKEARKYTKQLLTPQQIKQSILNSPWFQLLEHNAAERKNVERNLKRFLANLQEDLIEGIPLVLDPFVLYYIFTLDFSTFDKLLPILEPQDEKQEEHARRIKELIADCIRLYAVQKRFLALRSANVPPSEP